MQTEIKDMIPPEVREYYESKKKCLEEQARLDKIENPNQKNPLFFFGESKPGGGFITIKNNI